MDTQTTSRHISAKQHKSKKLTQNLTVSLPRNLRCRYCGQPRPCGCAESIAEQERIAADIAERKRAEFEQRARLLGLTGRLGKSTFDNFKPRDDWQDAERIAGICKAFADNPGGGWLVLQGNYGTGKSHLAAAIVRAVLERGEFARFIVWTEHLETVKASWNRNGISTDSIVKRTLAGGVLVLDDIDKKKPTEWAQERLFDVVNYRWNEQLPTVFTLNAPPKLARERLGYAVFDRIFGEAQWLTFDAVSYRSGARYVVK